MARKRKHIQIMSRLRSLDSLTKNNKLVVFGEQGNNLMASLESFKMVFGNQRLL